MIISEKPYSKIIDITECDEYIIVKEIIDLNHPDCPIVVIDIEDKNDNQ
jgi:hypothetical protein